MTSEARAADCNANGLADDIDLTRPRPELAITGGMIRVPRDGALLAIDLDGDGDQDAAVSDGQGVTWHLLENRDGNLAERSYSAGHRSIGFLAAGDDDVDGDMDLIAVSTDQMKVLRNDGGWQFTAVHVAAINEAPTGVGAGDLDGNGRADIALLGRLELTTILGLAAGLRQVHQVVRIHSEPIALILQDLDGDGATDLATANRLDSVSVALNEGSGMLSLARNFAAGRQRRSIAAADLDGDADPDLVTAGAQPAATLLRNRGDGFFPPALTALDASDGVQALATDINSDGAPDLLVGLGESRAIVGVLGGPEALLLRTWFPGAMTGLAIVSRARGESPEIIGLAGHHGVLTTYRFAPSHVSADVGGDGIPDECQGVPFVRGDMNASGQIELSDGISLILWLFLGGDSLFGNGEPPRCPESGDFNNDGRLDVADILGLLAYWNEWGPPPAPPALVCGFDPDPPGSQQDLGCSGPGPCL